MMNTDIQSSTARNSAFPLIVAAILFAPAMLLLMVPGASGAPPATKKGYEQFTLLQSRNIFDPDRTAPAPARTGERIKRVEVTQTTPPPKPTDYIVLTGIMITEDETLAFFAGTQPDYNKVLPLNGAIAGATVAKMTSSSIDVVRDGKTITVPVGYTVPLDDSTLPALPPAPAAPDPVAATPAAAPAPGTEPLDPQAAGQGVPLPAAVPGAAPTSPAPAAGGANDVLRRMMERRQKELQ